MVSNKDLAKYKRFYQFIVANYKDAGIEIVPDNVRDYVKHCINNEGYASPKQVILEMMQSALEE